MRELVNPNTRKKIYERDENKCKDCGSVEDLTIDHILPVVAGGTNDPNNLQTLCFKCNQLKSSRYKIPLWGRLLKIWYIHDFFQIYKDNVSMEVRAYGSAVQLRIDDQVKKYDSIVQSYCDKRIASNFQIQAKKISSLELVINGLNNTNRLQDRRIEELELAVSLLAEYLQIECRQSNQKPYFGKTI